ncbi:MAG: ATP-dependent helicase [Moorea sp. SIO3I7]|nr:ATP-dependent helicase [Moorena sp. SIO3I7]
MNNSKTWRSNFKDLINWNDRQLKVFEEVKNSTDNLSIQSVAGSGKTTTIYGIIATLPVNAKALVIAFNKHIASEIEADYRVPKRVRVSTSHSIGLSLLIKNWRGKKFKLNDRKYKELVDREVQKSMAMATKDHPFPEFEKEEDATAFFALLVNLVELVHQTLTPLEDKKILNMGRFYGLNLLVKQRYWGLSIIKNVVSQGVELAENKQEISYSDMLYLPWVWRIPAWKKDVVIVDECQDLSNAQHHIIQKFAWLGARVIVIGDEMQSIYGFAGADPSSFGRLRERFDCLDLTLDTCFRCPETHLDIARTYNKDILPAPGAIAGKSQVVDPKELPDVIRPGDLVLCRITAPLFDMCLQSVKKGVPSRVRGGEMVNALKGLARSLGDRSIDLGELESFLAAIPKEKIGSGLEVLLEALIYTVSEYSPNCLEDLNRYIDMLFFPTADFVDFSSIHRAKGDEASRVFILGSNFMPRITGGMLPWQEEQERNLTYVALTRSKEELYFVPYSESEIEMKAALKDEYGGLELPNEITPIKAPPKPGQLSLFEPMAFCG